MRMYNGQVRQISRDMIDELKKREAVELVEDQEEEARIDLESILREYIRVDRELSERARDLMRERGLGSNAFIRIKRRLAKQREFKIGDEAMSWIIDQLIEMLLYSSNVEEVYAEDLDLRVALRSVLKRFTEVESELDREVKGKLKNLEQGSQSWEIEYDKAMANLKRHKKLES